MTKLKDIYPLIRPSGSIGGNIMHFVDKKSFKISNEHITLTDYEKLKEIDIVCIFNQLPITIKLDCDFRELDIKERR